MDLDVDVPQLQRAAPGSLWSSAIVKWTLRKAAGRDTECRARSNAVKWHCEGRVILHGNRTVVLL